MHSILVAILAFSFISSAPAETAHPAEEQARPIERQLSPDEMTDIRAGHGRAMSLAAEINGYPGPDLVLGLSDALGLDDEQKREVEEIAAEMQTEAGELRARLAQQEAALDRAFADQTITPEGLSAAILEINRTQAQIRTAYLRHHIATAAVLDPAQRARYAELRGYSSPARQARL
ncbi:Spy/CpxP family protein refolding chaperone [Propylenella binzhouense]|uniref:Periplasmic heavy metal sensor n=1 Tax=Propylenella binzhouense TaxID=2555902 RepID=A0A964T4P6_9HYPH|nr:periplasmic heavy metal sensor [Propylenella binzhouense]MYZ47457.1 periplasmic heavy metal sensor [Propylenella binzhouense]